jgi:hypothetical protein
LISCGIDFDAGAMGVGMSRDDGIRALASTFQEWADAPSLPPHDEMREGLRRGAEALEHYAAVLRGLAQRPDIPAKLARLLGPRPLNPPMP